MPAQKHSLLLVDDEPDILFSLKNLLRREFELHTAESAQQALQILAGHPIDVIMTDQRMPDMTGVEMLCAVKSRYPEAIRIVFTGYADLRAVIEGVNRGGLHHYITKPWDPDEMLDMLREAAAEHDELAERNQLLFDMRRYMLEVRRQGLEPPSPDPTSGPGLQHDLAEQAAQLLGRLDRLLGDDQVSSGSNLHP